MMEQVVRKIKGVTKPCILVKHDDYGDDLLYCAVRNAVVTTEGPEDDIFPDQAPQLPDKPVWDGAVYEVDESDEDEANDDIIYNFQNNAEDIAQVRDKGFLVDDDNDPAPKNIPATNAVEVAPKKNGLPLDQEWGGTTLVINRRKAIITRMLK